jgi:uncharacterized hydantoinase/oxoprolinase family protein
MPPRKKTTKKESTIKKSDVINTLGIDLSIGKVKLCLISYDKNDKKILGGWSSLPVPFDYIAEKEYDYNRNLTVAIEAFLTHHGKEPKDINSIVFCSGGAYYMFKTFAEGLRYTAGILKMIFPRQKVYFIRCDSKLFDINEIFDLEDDEASAFSSTNFLGTSLLASKFFDEGLAIDMGTISTSIIPIINGVIDPISRHNPKGYTHHRYSTGKHIWYGVMHTPLNYITYQAKTKRSSYNLILRSCTTSTLCNIFNLLDPESANRHVYDHAKMTDNKLMEFIKLAETVGLDINSVSSEELVDIAHDIYAQMLINLSNIIKNILINMNYTSFENLKVLASGLGQDAFIVPALKNCGFESHQIIKIAEDKRSDLWSASSVYGLAILALETIIDEPVQVSIENPD